SKRCGGPVVVCYAPKPPDAQEWDKVWRTNRSWSVFPPANARTQLLFPCTDRRSRCWGTGGTDKNLRDDLRAWVDGSDAKAFVIPSEAKWSRGIPVRSLKCNATGSLDFRSA